MRDHSANAFTRSCKSIILEVVSLVSAAEATSSHSPAEPPTHLIRISLSSNQRGSPCALTTQPSPRNPGQPPRPTRDPPAAPSQPPCNKMQPHATKSRQSP